MKLKFFITTVTIALFISTTYAQVGIGTTSPVSTLDVRGSASFNNRTLTSSCTLNSTDHTVVFTGTSAATITFPSAAGCTGREIYVKNYSSNSSTITIATTASQTIDGNSTYMIRNQYEVILFMSDGSNWIVKDQSYPSTAGSAWYLKGNTGTTAGTNFIGTNDAVDFVTKTNGSEVMRASSGGNVGIGTTSPGSKLDVKGTLRLSGATSGYVGFSPAAAAGSTTYTLPAADGSSGQALVTNGSGTLSWAAPSIATTHTLSSATNTITSVVNGVSATASAVNSVANTSATNTLTTTVNGVAATGVNIINSNALTAASSALTSTVNGVAATLTPAAGTIGTSSYLGFDASGNLVKGSTPTASTTNTLALSTNTLTSTVNGVAATASAVGSVSNTSSTNSLTTTVNGVAGTAVNIINSNATSLSGTNLTTTVNGVAATALDLSPAITSKAWSLTGNSGTTYAANFLGTTDSKSLRFRTNNVSRMTIDSLGNVGIATLLPGSALDVKGTLRLSGATSGYVGFAPAAAAGATTYTLPSADGTSGQQLTTNGAGVLTWTNQTGATTVSNTSSANTLSTTVNGTTGSTVNIINTNALNSSTNTLTSTVNGVAATGVNIINSNALTAASSALTSTVNGVASTLTPSAGTVGTSSYLGFDASGNLVKGAVPASTVSNSSSTNTLTTTVNGVAATGVNIINSNALTAASSALTSTVNGVASTLTPSAGTIGASTFLGFDASGNLVKGSASANAWNLTGNSGTSYATNFLGTTDNKSLRIKTNNTARMIVDSLGNVGIGTASPGSLLETMNGNVKINNNNNTAGQLQFTEPSTGGTNKTTFAAQSQSADINYTLPAAAPAANTYVMTATTAGVMSWTNPATMVGGVLMKYKTADQTSTTTTMADDNDLQFTIGANEVWQVEFYLFTSGGTAGFQSTITVPTSATMKFGYHADNENSNDDFEEITTSGTATTTNFEIVDNGSVMHIMGLVKNSSNAGSVKLRWARYNTTGTLTIQSLSYCKATRVQ